MLEAFYTYVAEYSILSKIFLTSKRCQGIYCRAHTSIWVVLSADSQQCKELLRGVIIYADTQLYTGSAEETSVYLGLLVLFTQNFNQKWIRGLAVTRN